MRQLDLKRARRRAYEKRRRNWELSPQRRHELTTLKQYYADLEFLSDSETQYDLGAFTRCPAKSEKFH